MVGYGGEDDHFVMELTYNYGIKNYRKGNEFLVYTAIVFPASPFLFLCCIGQWFLCVFAEYQHLLQGCGGENQTMQLYPERGKLLAKNINSRMFANVNNIANAL